MNCPVKTATLPADSWQASSIGLIQLTQLIIFAE